WNRTRAPPPSARRICTRCSAGGGAAALTNVMVLVDSVYEGEPKRSPKSSAKGAPAVAAGIPSHFGNAGRQPCRPHAPGDAGQSAGTGPEGVDQRRVGNGLAAQDSHSRHAGRLEDLPLVAIAGEGGRIQAE